MRKPLALLTVGLLAGVIVAAATAKPPAQLSAQAPLDPTQTFSATGDSYIDSGHPDTNYGSSNRLWIKWSSPVQRTYLQFNVSLPAGSTITSSTLNVFVGAGSSLAGFDVYGEPNTSWTEGGITYNNAPPFGSKLGNSGPWASGHLYLSFPMPAGSIVPGLNSIGVTRPSTASSAVDFFSREGGNPPLLTVNYTTTTTASSDTTPPTVPTGVTATAGDQQNKLQWTASTDPDSPVAGYYVFRDGTKIATVSGTSYTDTGLTDGTTYSYDVVAFDPAGNVSGPSSVVSATPKDTTPPSAPTNLAAKAGDKQVSLMWTGSTDNVAVAGYDVFRNGTQVGSTTATSFTDTGLADGTTYTYAVKTFDAAGNVSPTSNSVTATPQAPPPANPVVPADRFMYFDGTGASAPYGFTIADVSGKAEADALPTGVRGQIWVGDYNNSTCQFDVSDVQLESEIQGNAGDPKIGGYDISDEPDPLACPNAPQQHAARTALIHQTDTDPSHYVMFVLDSNSGSQTLNQIPLWKGAADHIGLDPYPCSAGQSTCNFAWVQSVISAADGAGLNYWGVVQAFQDGTWRWPTSSELSQLLSIWETSHETGIGAFAWKWTDTSTGTTTDLSTQPGLLSVFQSNFGGQTADTTAPSTPAGFAATSNTTASISTSWTASTDNVGVAGYDLYQNGVKVGTTTSTSHTFGALTCGTAYTLAVDAFDAAGNVSGRDSISASTAACPVADTTPPSVPTGLTANPGDAQVSLSWTASTDPDDAVASYNIYRNQTKVASSATTNFTDTGLTNGTTYSYQVSAVDSHGNESALSSAVSATPQASSPPPPGSPHIMDIVMENHGAGAIIGNTSAPFQNSLTSKYITLTNWTGIDHPSAPNYVGMVTGQDNGLAGAGDCSPSIGSSCDWSGDNLGNQMFVAGVNAKWFAEDLNGNGCSISNSESGNNDVNHEPWAYMDNWQATPGACAEAGLTTASPSDPEVVSALQSANPPSFVWVTPNLTDDTHDGTVSQGDTYLKNLVTAVQATSWYANGGTIVITYDEDEGETNPPGYCTNPVVLPAVGNTCIPTFIVSAKDANVGAVSTPGDHYGMLRSIEECYGLPLLNNAAAVDSSGLATYGDIKARLC